MSLNEVPEHTAQEYIAGGVGAQLKVKYGAGVDVESSDAIVINQVRDDSQFQYAKTVE